MIGKTTGRLGLIALGWFLAWPSGASAQFVPMPATPPAGTSVPTAAVMANPYLNPYLNPYINPAATQRAIKPGDAALYLYTANAARGGIGSGVISQGRSGIYNQGQAVSPKSKPAMMPDSSAVPGAGAAKYFNPGPVNANGAGRYYSGRRNYFNNNGR